MRDETTVSAADIARLADVGRTAVSNWRRRYADFPQPVGGTPASPLFALAEIETWLRDQGKLLEMPLAERAWQALTWKPDHRLPGPPGCSECRAPPDCGGSGR